MLDSIIGSTSEPEEVILLNDAGQAIGRAGKAKVHTRDTPLHYAFSVFLFNSRGQMLVQQRAWSKPTWPGIWSNACCGHPLPGETLEHAAQRRLVEELNLSGVELTLALPDFRYRAEYLGVVENELCPVLIGISDAIPTPNPDEVEAIDWIDWIDFANGALVYSKYSPWSKWEAEELHRSGLVAELITVSDNLPTTTYDP